MQRTVRRHYKGVMCEVNCSIEYTEQLIKETVYQSQQGGSALTDDVPQPLCSTYEHHDKETAVEKHKSQFLILHH